MRFNFIYTLVQQVKDLCSIMSLYNIIISTIIVSADKLSPPQNIKSWVVEYHVNFSTIKITWEPPNGSRVDIYYYQLLNNVTDVPVQIYNTTETVVIFPNILYNVNNLFFISAYNCKGESAQVSIVIGKRKHDNSIVELSITVNNLIL